MCSAKLAPGSDRRIIDTHAHESKIVLMVHSTRTRAQRPYRQTGFTLVELLVVIAVIAILAAISIVSYNGISLRATDTKLRHTANSLEK